MENLEQYESFERTDTPFELDLSQQQLVEVELNKVGGEDLLLSSDNRDVVIECYDRSVKYMRPDLKTAANLSPMKSYSPAWDNFVGNYLESPYLEAFTDLEQVEYISDYMANIEDIRYENWKELSLDQKLKVLNEMEKHIAAIEHRPASPIFAEDLNEKTFGYQQYLEGHPEYDKIAINTSIFEASNYDPEVLDQVLDTLIHEGRHRYQHYNVEERLVHESPAAVEQWRQNFKNFEDDKLLGYADGSPIHAVEIGPINMYTNERLAKLGFRLYWYQPVESDARRFASDVMGSYHNKIKA